MYFLCLWVLSLAMLTSLAMTSALPDDVKHLSWAAERLGIGLSTAYRLAKAGHMPGAFQIGVQWRISVPAFEAAVHGTAAAS